MTSQELPILEAFIAGAEGGPSVTFVPGIGNDADFWLRQADVLGATLQTIRFEPWGCGGSEEPPQECTIDIVVDGIVQLWDRAGVERSSLVGLGFGGSVALAAGLAYPDRVSRIAAFCCRARQPDERRTFWRTRRQEALDHGLDPLTDVTVDRWLSETFRAVHPQPDHALRVAMRRNSVDGYRAYVEAFIGMDFSAELARLRLPTLLVAAEHDHGGGPVADMAAMYERIPGSKFAIVPNSGHICNHEAPEEVDKLLLDFLVG